MEAKLLNARYRIIEELGHGGFARTYIAEDIYRPSKQRCVIKQLSLHNFQGSLSQDVLRRFEREAEALEKLGDSISTIPKLYAYFTEGGEFYLVQELIFGQTLAKKITDEGPFDEAYCVTFLSGFLRTLEQVHSRNVIHRDITPKNIIIRDKDGEPILIDFGLVKAVILSSGNSTMPYGTPGYAPIEQALGHPVFATDIYSLGIIAVCILTKKDPGYFTSKQTGEVMLDSIPGITPEFLRFIAKAVKLDARDRYQNATEMRLALSRLLDTQPSPVPEPAYVPQPTPVFKPEPIPTPSPSLEPVPQSLRSKLLSKRKWIKLAWSLALVLGIILIIVVIAVRNHQELRDLPQEIKQVIADVPPENTENNKSAENYHGKGKDLFKQGKFAEAEAEYRKAVALNQNNAEYHNDLGAALIVQKNNVEAEEEFRKAVTINENDARYRNNLGAALGLQNKYAEAEVEYRKAVALDQNNAKYQNSLGNALYNQKKYAEAEAEYQKAIALNQNNAGYHNSLGSVLYDQKKYAEAEAEYRKAVALDQNNAEYDSNLGDALNDQQKYVEAEAKYRKAVALDQNNAEYQNSLGNALYNQKKYAEAEAKYRKAVALNQNDADFHFNLGDALDNQKKYTDAAKEFRVVLTLDPKNSDAIDRLVEVQKKSEEAR